MFDRSAHDRPRIALVIDHDPRQLTAFERALRRRYSTDYEAMPRGETSPAAPRPSRAGAIRTLTPFARCTSAHVEGHGHLTNLAGRRTPARARGKELAKRLAGKQAEKDRYVRAYARGHISEEELDVYLAELKKQIDNLRVLLASVEAELSERQERTALTDTTHAWLLALRRRLAEVEEDTPEGFEKRK